MSKIHRQSFVGQQSGKQLDLQKLRVDVGARSALDQAGSSVGDIARADLNHDGKISGDREMNALFDRADYLDSDGNSNSLIDIDRAGNQAPAGKVLSTLGLLMENQGRDGLAGLQGSVGTDGANSKADVKIVQQRLKDLGFNIAVDGGWGKQTKNSLQVFGSMLNGNEAVSDTTSTLRAGSDLHRALGSSDAPRWERMPSAGTGFRNADTDGYSYGSGRLADMVKDAGQRYHDSYLRDHPDATPLSINDASRRNGGANRDHETHQAGLDLDLRLPKTDGGAGTKTTWRSYNRDASYHMAKALAEDPRVERVIITDSRLIQRALDSGESWAVKLYTGGNLHKSHFHVDILPYPPM